MDAIRAANALAQTLALNTLGYGVVLSGLVALVNHLLSL